MCVYIYRTQFQEWLIPDGCKAGQAGLQPLRDLPAHPQATSRRQTPRISQRNFLEARRKVWNNCKAAMLRVMICPQVPAGPDEVINRLHFIPLNSSDALPFALYPSNAHMQNIS